MFFRHSHVQIPKLFYSRLRRSQNTTCFRLGFAPKMSNSRAIDFAALSVSRVAFENMYGSHFGCLLDIHMSESLKFSARAQTATNFWLHCAPKMSSSGVCNFGAIWLSLVSCDFEQKFGSHLGVFQILTLQILKFVLLAPWALGMSRRQLAFGWAARQK